MSFFDNLRKPGSLAIKPQGSQIRKEVIRTSPVSASQRRITLPSKGSLNAIPKVPRQLNGGPRSREVGLKQRKQDDLTPLDRGKNKSRKRPSPVQQRLQSSSQSSDSEGSLSTSKKRSRSSKGIEPDLKRRVRSQKAFAKDDGLFDMVHAADIASLDKPNQFTPAFGGSAGSVETLLLQYPSASQQERYNLVVPREHDEFKPLDEIIQVIDLVSRNYLPSAEIDVFTDDTDGILRRLKRAIFRQSVQEFRDVIQEYNGIITRRRLDGTISAKLDSTHNLELPLIERLLTQTYSRTVSPRVKSLRQYENGTDNVYGELLPRFLSQIFKDTKLRSDQIFVDLGSGVGNAVLQAALEVGCESWGCEVMENACDLAGLQEKEFEARCRLWGLEAGGIHLERGDFLTSASTGKVIQKADVVLVNNQAFTPELNNGLISLFLDLKEGCQIVSLKSFVPHGHKITPRNLNSPVNLLEVESKQYWSDSVSWTDAAGTYFVARKDSTKLRSFAHRMS
ncbi:MAG: Nucleosomal histone H3-Lys79 methylase [Pleopsidium flavum]|nr:MAG: Nucleosomal histone H3-Lys79 methylase [Pleopsidium flavum]